MAEQAVAEPEAEVVEDGEPAAEKSPLDAFDDFLNGQPEKIQDEPVVTEPESGDEPAAATDPVEAEASVAEAVDEGPSFLMKQAALTAGVDPDWLSIAKDDAQLEQMIEVARKNRPAKTEPSEPEKDELELEVSLSEDEYGPDDPVRKHLVSWAEKLNKQRTETKQYLSSLAAVANQQLQSQEREVWHKLYDPLNETLDSFESPLLGKTGSETPAQKALRISIAERYVGVGATHTMSAAEMKRLADLTIAATRPDLVEQRTKKQQAAARQPSKVIGGNPAARPVKGTPTYEESMSDWNAFLEGKKPLPTE